MKRKKKNVTSFAQVAKLFSLWKHVVESGSIWLVSFRINKGLLLRYWGFVVAAAAAAADDDDDDDDDDDAPADEDDEAKMGEDVCRNCFMQIKEEEDEDDDDAEEEADADGHLENETPRSVTE